MADPTDLRRPGQSHPGVQPVAATLEQVNEQFHEAYDGARSQAKHDCPVLILLADTLVVFRRGERIELRYTPEPFAMLKAIAHAPVALYAELQRDELPGVTEGSRRRLEQLQQRVLRSQQQLDSEASRASLTAAALDDVDATLQRCAAMLQLALAGTSSDVLEQFAKDIGPILLRLTHEATRLQLESLHACVERALAPMTREERAGLHVVVTGDHQARARSLGMQYFRARLNEPDATEERLAYAEGVSDEQAALELVGTRRLDHAIAAAFFGDRKRLQRDILGDSAAALLKGQRFEPIA